MAGSADGFVGLEPALNAVSRANDATALQHPVSNCALGAFSVVDAFCAVHPAGEAGGVVHVEARAAAGALSSRSAVETFQRTQQALVDLGLEVEVRGTALAHSLLVAS